MDWVPESAFRVLPHACLSTDRHNDGPSLVILSAVELVVVMVSPGWAGSIRLWLICYEQVASHSRCFRSHGHAGAVFAGTSTQSLFSQAMECVEGDWVDGVLASRPCSTTGCPIVWQCFISDHHKAACWADFKPDQNRQIEHAYATGNREPLVLSEAGGTWNIDFIEMVQVSNTPPRTQREIRRIVIVAASDLKR